MVEVECGGFIFTSNFESGNLARVELVNPEPKLVAAALPPAQNGQLSNNTLETPDYEFNIWTNPDCAGTEFENGNRSWFYFGIRGGTPFALVKLNLVNLNRQVKMYSQGMAPVFRVLPGRGLWDRIRDKPTYTTEDNVFTLSFRYRTLENTKATTYFAFTFPYSYQDLMSALKNFDKRFRNVPPPEKYLPGHFAAGVSADDIYYHRELAINSLDGRRLDLLTITSHHGITPHREPRFKNLFPDLDTPRPNIFSGKKVIFVSARVHPGEVPSSYVLNGFIEALLNRDDLTSVLLRRMYVFKIIPMLNPDGVARGHFRTDTRGVNLNRVYTSPSLEYHPTIYAARAIIKFAHFGKEVPDEPENAEMKPLIANPSGSPQLSTLRVTNRVNPIQRTHSTLSLPQSAMVSSCSNHSLRSTVSLPQSLQIAHHSDLKDNAATSQSDDCGNVEDSDQVAMDVEKPKDDEELRKKVFCAGFPSEPSLAPRSKITEPDAHKVETSAATTNRKNSQSALELSFRHVINFSAQKTPNHAVHAHPHAHQCTAEESGNECVKERKVLRRKHHSTGSARLIKRQVVRSPEEEFRDDTSRMSSFNVAGVTHLPAKPSLDPSKSGLFLYMDMHGHASKKGIFMYGNHFDDIDQLVECMLLPKIMSINSQNFHFNACNFTERNMYLRDRRDGMSREGCGRVSVMKMTGLVRSYTLECNYNTGRIVNLLPPCVRDYARMAINVAYSVPPKYTPLVFEDVGRALAVSILDLTNSNPCSRIPNSDYRSVNGVREWLRSNCMSDNQIWSRMLHRPTRQPQQQQLQVSQSSGNMVAPTRSRLGAHVTKSALIARISSELNHLGEEFARKEGLPLQKASSCNALVDSDNTSSCAPSGPSCSGSPPSPANSEPKENIGPAAVTSTSVVCTGPTRPGTSSVGQPRPRRRLRAVGAHVKARRSVCSTLETAALDSSSATINSIASGTTSTPSNVELCLNAAPKRPKVAAKVVNKSRRKQIAWVSSEDASSPSDLPPKSVLLTKQEKSLRGERFRTGTLAKAKKLSPQSAANIGETSKTQQVKLDVSQGFINFVGKLNNTKETKASVSTSKQGSNTSVDKEWIRAKNAARFSKALKPDSEPSTSEPSCSSVTCGAKSDVKLKSGVLRSMEKGSKSRLLCPMRRRSNEGKKAWKSLERKSDT